MKVRMITRAAGPDWKANMGDEIDLPVDVVVALVQGAYAEPLEKPVVEKPTVETAAVDPPTRKAVRPTPRKR